MNIKTKRIKTPLNDKIVESLHMGDRVLLSGFVYTARDAAHERMLKALRQGDPLHLTFEARLSITQVLLQQSRAHPLDPLGRPRVDAWIDMHQCSLKWV